MCRVLFDFFFFKQKTAYEMRISDWSSDVCSSDLMVSIRLWVEPDRIVSALLRRLMAVEDVQTALAEKRGPKTAPGLLVGVADRLVARMAPTVDSLGEAIDAVEDESLDPRSEEHTSELQSLMRISYAVFCLKK